MITLCIILIDMKFLLKTSSFFQICINHVDKCDGRDDCGDLSDEDFTSENSLCKGYKLNDFENLDAPLQMFQNEPSNTLQWHHSSASWDDRGKSPLFDHSTNSDGGHFLHVGGSYFEASGESQPKKGRIISPKLRVADGDICAFSFFSFGLLPKEEVGSLKLILM